MRKVGILILILLCVIGCSSAAAAASLTLPSSLKTIGDEAFAGDLSIGTVVLPEGIESIGARAFANSSLTKINLPASVTRIGEGAFAGVKNVNATVIQNSYAHRWCQSNSVPCTPVFPDGALTAYVSRSVLESLGLALPATVNDLYDVIDRCGDFGVVGIAAQDYEEFLFVFRVIDPAFGLDRLSLMIAAGELCNFRETGDPFGTGALFVVSDEAPVSGGGYEVFAAGIDPGVTPSVTPSPTPKPTPRPLDGLTAYVNRSVVESLGLTLPATANDLFDVIETCGDFGVVGIAAQHYEEFLVAFRVLSPSFQPEIVAVMIAAGELWNFRETGDPFGTGALFVISGEAPATGGGYEVFAAGIDPGVTPSVTPSPTPKPTPRPLDGLTAYVNRSVVESLGLTLPATANDLFDVIETCGDFGVVGIAAQHYEEFLVAFRVLSPSFQPEIVAVMIASGELWNFRETGDPFGTGALFVVSGEPPADGSGYEAFVI